MGCSMPAQLVSLTDGPSILLDKPILLIGRHPECDIQIDSRKISRRHCCIAQVGEYLVVRDLGSTNGVRINGVRVLEGRLKANDELTIGGHRYQISWDMLPPSSHSESGRRRHSDPDRPFDPINPEEDDLLEACDEPVPLADHAPASRKAPVPPKPLDQELVPPSPPAYEESPFSLIIPEDIGLAPASDMDLGTPRPS
jgi:predicted component of type VI protein secretion system